MGSYMERTTTSVIVRHPGGNGEDAHLEAVIDESADENIITWKRWRQLEDLLQLESKPLASSKVVVDSQGVSYTVQSQVSMSIKQRGARCSSSLRDYVAESENVRIAGRYDILLAKSWKEKFAPDGQNGNKIYSAAPSQLKGFGSKRQ
ncbi:uncharacterized protein BJX67DRAFT_266349 [Aspergillus lucknowensis]|uniref:Uncharacterized protein n=1 Tax=Aspergillus lucknowensis TaxID=176173 RepID=A0ABR4LF47_9EURO